MAFPKASETMQRKIDAAKSNSEQVKVSLAAY
jgi:hypothetical protein